MTNPVLLEQRSERPTTHGYRLCCCGITVSAQIFSILSIIFVGIYLFFCIYFLVRDANQEYGIQLQYNELSVQRQSVGQYNVWAIIEIVWLIINIAGATLTLFGIFKKNHNFLIMELVLNCINPVYLSVLYAAVIYAVAIIRISPDKFGVLRLFCLTSTLIFMVSIIFNVWVFIINLQCYRYLKANQKWLRQKLPYCNEMQRGSAYQRNNNLVSIQYSTSSNANVGADFGSDLARLIE